ncbi:MAG: GtrA family protein [Candidatus Paceibacterota bacterium]
MKFSKKDLLFSVITGLITGFAAWKIFVFLGQPEVYGVSVIWLQILVPVFWVMGVNLGYFLGRWFGFFNQFGKFAAIGFTNAAVDFGILNLFIAKTGETAGTMYAVFKGTSFIVATFHSYVWNKYWAFDAGQSHGRREEFLKFFSIALLALLINVGIASFVVNFVPPVTGLDNRVWANIGAVVASAAALLFSFVGFRMVVFKK